MATALEPREQREHVVFVLEVVQRPVGTDRQQLHAVRSPDARRDRLVHPGDPPEDGVAIPLVGDAIEVGELALQVAFVVRRVVDVADHAPADRSEQEVRGASRRTSRRSGQSPAVTSRPRGVAA